MHKKLDKNKIDSIISMTNSQLGIFYHCLKSNRDDMYTIQSKIEIEGQLNIDRFCDSLKKLINDNEVLRSSFRWENVKNPLCMILKQEKLPFTMYNYSWASKHSYVEYVDSICDELFKKGIKLDSDFLIEFVLVQKNQNQYTLIIQYHHIIMDGWSLGNLVKNLFGYYENKEDELLKKFDYSKYIKEINNMKLEESSQYWKKYLKDFETQIDLEIKSNENISSLKENKSKFSFSVYDEDKDYLNKLLTEKGILLSAFVYSMWAILLHKYTAEDDVLFGTVVSGRDIDVPSIIDAIGFFSNTIPCRTKINRNQKFIDFLKSVNQDQIDVTQYNRTPLNHIKKCSDISNGEDLFSTLVVIENYPIPNVNGAISIKSVEVIEQNNFPIILGVFKNKGIEFELEYDCKKYGHKAIERLASHLQNIIHTVLNDTDILIKDIDVLLEVEKRKLLNDFNSTEMEFPRESTVGMLFSEQAKRTPEAIAIRFEEKEISYRDLDKLSSVLSNKVLEKGAKNDDIVCIMMDTSIEAILSMIAVMKSGAAFLPIDIKYPKERINEIRDQNKSKLIITTKKFYEKFKLNIDECIFVDEINNKGVERANYSKGKDLAYLIATSGTTGKPKSIMVKNESFIDFICWVKQAYEYKEGIQGSLSLPFAFDSALLQIFPPIISGGTLNLINPEKRKNPKYYLKYLKENKINVIDEIPTVMNILFDYIEQEKIFDEMELLPELRCISLGSEYVPIEVAEKCRKYLNHGGNIINSYGPAEASVVATTYLFNEKAKTDKFLIGKPRFNTKVYIINKYRELCPIGVPGELCISGVCLAKGYCNDEIKTNEKFVQNFFSDEEDYKTIYKTGDKAYWMDDGNIDFLGRIDNQIKYHGYRIELEEIEKRLQSVFESKNIVVIDKTINSFKQVVAYVETSDEIDINKIRIELGRKLPNYMIPSRFIAIDTLPKNPNGKIDRNKLRKMKDLPIINSTINHSENITYNKTMSTIRNVWVQILGHDNFTENDNFYDVGGDSITLVNMYMQLKKEFKNIEIDISDLFSYTTVGEIAEYYRGKQGKEIASDIQVKFKEIDGDVSNDIAIVGMAGRFPKANNIFEFWEVLSRREDCISDIPEERKAFDLSGYKDKKYLKWGYMNDVDKFDPLFFKISPKVAVSMDPHHRQMLEVSYLAVENSGYFATQNPSKNVGVFMGAVMPTYMKYVKDIAVDELLSSNLPANVAGRVAYHMGFQGPTVTMDTACSSSLVALHYAMTSLRNKECDMAIAGGVYIQIDPIEYDYALGSGIASPTQHCNTFSDNADGTIGGEGCVAVVLKPLNEAIKNNDYIYSVIKGSAINHGGDRSNGITAPNSDAQAECIRKAWKDSKVNPETISYIEAHGTGTKLGDPIEISGIQKAFNGSGVISKSIPIGSLKTNMGHLDSAAGLAGLIKTAMSLNKKTITPLLNYKNPNPYINFEKSPVYVENRLINWKEPDCGVRRAGVSSFGLSGTNCHVVLEEYINNIEQNDENFESNELIVISGSNENILVNQLRLIYNYLKKDETVRLKDVSYTLGIARKAYNTRKAFIVSSKEQLLEEINLYLQNKTISKKQEMKIEDIKITINDVKIDGFKNLVDCELSDNCKKFLNSIDNSDEHDILKNYIYLVTLFSNLGFKENSFANDKLAELSFKIINNNISVEELKGFLKQYSLKNASHYEENKNSYKLAIIIGNKGESNNKLESSNIYSEQLITINKNDFERDILKLIAKLYECGIDLNLNRILKGRVIPLPSEPFKKEPYWAEKNKLSNSKSSNIDFEKSIEKINNKNILHEIKWRKVEKIATDLGGEELKDKTILIFKNKDDVYHQLINTLRDNCKHLIIITLGEEFKNKSINEYEISCMEEQHYKMVFEIIERQHKSIDYQFILLNDDSNIFASRKHIEVKIKQLILTSIYSFKYLERFFNSSNINNYFITQKAYNVGENDSIASSYLNMAAAINRTINQELSNIKSFIIDIDESMIKNTNNSQVNLLKEICSNNEVLQVCYRNEERYLPYLCNKDFSGVKLFDQIKDEGIYIITGGTGGIGLEVAKHIAKRRNVKLILLSRSKISFDINGACELNNMDLRKKNIIESVEEIRDGGSQVEILSADVSDYEEMKKAISHIEKKFGEINGVIHAAGIQGVKKTFITSTWDDFDKVFKSKIYGLMVLEKLFRNKFLEFFISFSSADAYLSKDMSSYSCANAFIDSFSIMNRQFGRKFISINWGGWRGIGMGSRANIQNKSIEFNDMATLRNITMSQIGFSSEEGLSSFDVILSSNSNNVIVTEFDDKDINDVKETLFYKVDELIENNKSKESYNLGTENIDIDHIKNKVKEIWKHVLELKEIDEKESFYTYGGDSINGIEIMLKLSSLYGIKLDISILFEYNTVADLSDYILNILKHNKDKEKIKSIPKAKPIN